MICQEVEIDAPSPLRRRAGERGSTGTNIQAELEPTPHPNPLPQEAKVNWSQPFNVAASSHLSWQPKRQLREDG